MRQSTPWSPLGFGTQKIHSKELPKPSKARFGAVFDRTKPSHSSLSNPPGVQDGEASLKAACAHEDSGLGVSYGPQDS